MIDELEQIAITEITRTTTDSARRRGIVKAEFL